MSVRVLAMVLAVSLARQQGAGASSHYAKAAQGSPAYPGAATARMEASVGLVEQLDASLLKSGTAYETIRLELLKACGLQDRQRVREGYTGHCFADFNHVDCCTMLGSEAHNKNEGSPFTHAPARCP